MEKNNQTKLTPKERTRFEELLEQAQQITLYNSRVLIDQNRLRKSKQPAVAAR